MPRTNPQTEITERQPFELDDGSELVRIRLSHSDRLEITDEASDFCITVQYDGEGPPEISVLEGRVTLYT